MDLNSEDVSRMLGNKGERTCSGKIRLVTRANSVGFVSRLVGGIAHFYIRLSEHGCEFLAIKEA
jgi:hypothetical protein